MSAEQINGRSIEDKYEALRNETLDAHNRITWVTQELAWASDGSITSAANQVEAYVKRLTAQRDSARLAVEAIQTGIPGVLEEILSHPSMAATRIAINESLQSLVNKAVAGTQHHLFRNLEFDYPTEPIAIQKEA